MRLPSLALNRRYRLVLITSGTFGVLLGAVLVAVVLGFQSWELEATYDSMSSITAKVVNDLKIQGDRVNIDAAAELNPHATVAVFSDDGRPLTSHGRLPVQVLEGKRVLAAGNHDIAQVGVRQGRRLVVAGLNWDEKQEAIGRFSMLLFVLWFPLVGAAALVSWLAAGATLKPLMHLTSQAEELSQHQLGGRLVLAANDEYAQFASKLNQLLDRVEASVNRQERFVADAAHELRTPLTVFRGQIEASLRKARTPEEYRTTLGVLLSEAERLSLLVEALLQSASADRETPPPMELDTAAEKAHARWVDRFERAGVRLDLEVNAASSRIGEAEFDVVVDNLLANALRASPPETRCLIELQRKDGQAVLGITDEGPGIPDEELERIFERFARVDDGRSRSRGGFGIGLAVCKRIVEGRGGTIRAVPADRGAEFEVSLPLAASREGSRTTVPS